MKGLAVCMVVEIMTFLPTEAVGMALLNGFEKIPSYKDLRGRASDCDSYFLPSIAKKSISICPLVRHGRMLRPHPPGIRSLKWALASGSHELLVHAT
jgi:hypothetical protein